MRPWTSHLTSLCMGSSPGIWRAARLSVHHYSGAAHLGHAPTPALPAAAVRSTETPLWQVPSLPLPRSTPFLTDSGATQRCRLSLLKPGCCKDPEACSGLESLLRHWDGGTVQVPGGGSGSRDPVIHSPGASRTWIFQPKVRAERFPDSDGAERAVTQEQLVPFARFTS